MSNESSESSRYSLANRLRWLSIALAALVSLSSLSLALSYRPKAPDLAFTELLASNCTPALLVNSEDMAGNTLSPLARVPSVWGAVLLDAQDQPLGSFFRGNQHESIPRAGELDREGYRLVHHTIRSDGKKLGSLHLRMEATPTPSALPVAALLVLILIGVWAVGNQVSHQLQIPLELFRTSLQAGDWSAAAVAELPQELAALVPLVRPRSPEPNQAYNVLTSSLQEILIEVKDDLTILNLNQVGLNLLGYDPVAARELKIGELVDGGDLLFRDWPTKFGKETVVQDAHLKTAEGETVPVRLSVTVLHDGQSRRLMCMARDLSPLVRAREAEQRYTQLLDSSHDLIPVMSEDGTLQGSNRAWKEALGFDPDQPINQKSIFGFIHPDHRERFRSHFERVLRGDKLEPFEALVQGRNGKLVTIEGTLSFVKADGSPASVRGIFRDISKRKEVESALEESEMRFLGAQKMEAVGRLAGGIAHDFNNVLTAITGYSELMSTETNGDELLEEGLTEISRAADRARDLTRQLLTFSRKNVVRPEVLDFSRVLSELDKMLRRLIGKDIEFVTTLDPHLFAIKADPGQLEQVLMNLAINARQAMPDGGIFSICAKNYRTRGQNCVRLEIVDTGVGMDEATRSRIFEPFFTTKEEGTGLGLATAYGIITRFGGQIQVHSKPGKGTRFVVDFPAVDAPVPERPELRVFALAGAGSNMETILVVEDEANIRRLVKKILERVGYKVLIASYGDEALRISRQHEGRIDLLVTDMVMPKMSGRVLADKFGQERAETPVLYMSGYSDDPFLNSVVAFIPKPFTPHNFLAKVRQVIDTKSPTAVAR